MKTLRRYRTSLGGFMTLLVALWQTTSPLNVQAATYYWDNNGTGAGFSTVVGAWNTGAFWGPNATGTGGTYIVNPTSADDLNIVTATTNTGSITVTGAKAASSITFASGVGAVTITGGTSLTIGGTGTSSGIFNASAAAQVIATPIILATAATIQNTGAGLLTLSGVVSGANTLTKTGTGIAALSGANTYTGVTTINAGTLRVSNATALGTNATVTLAAAGTTLDIRGTITIGTGKTVTLNTNTTGDLRSTLTNGANNNTWAGNVVLAGTGFAAISAAANTTLTVTGNITSAGAAGTGSMAVRGTGTVILNGNINLGTERAFSHTDAGTVIVNTTGNTWTRAQVSNGQIQIGINNALDTGKEFTFGQNAAGDGRLELNGFNQAVTRLNSFATSSGTHTLRNSNLTTASTLTFATPTATIDTLTNVQVHGAATGLGALHLVSNGLGRTEFNGGLVAANSWTVNSGTIAFTGANDRILSGSVTGLAAATIEKAGGTTLAATSAWNNAGITNVTGGALVLGAGTAGTINVSDAATLGNGLGGGVLTSSAVTFGTAGTTTYVPLLTNAAVAPLTATTLTNAGTTVTVAPQAGSFTASTTYRLLDYTTVSGLAGFTLAPLGSYPHITATLDTATTGQINLVVGAVDTLIWAGQTDGIWDVNTTTNFALASSTSTGATFFQGDVVVFGDTHDVGAPGTAVTNSTIAGGGVTIGNLTFNNSTVAYSVANPLTGAGGITKIGTAAVTLSGNNSYAGVTSVSDGTLTLSGANVLGGGAVNVTGGTLSIGNSDALRGAGLVTVSGGGTFDANGTAVGVRYPELVVSGDGVGMNGAIVNNGADLTNTSHFAKITLAGNTTWGGSGRYDLTTGQIFNGGAFTLTKTGTGQMWYNPSAGSTLETVIVNGGAFGLTGANPLSTTATVTVNTGATHQFFNAISVQHKVVLNDGSILRQSNATAGTLTGQVTLNGTTADRNIQAFLAGTLNIAGKITGTGGFTVNEGGTVQLQNATNDYAGDTKITLGTLNFSATGILPATTNLIIDGGTFGTAALPRSVASLSGAGGIISGGSVLTSNQGTTTVWNGALNGTTAQMSGIGSLTLGGTADNSSGIAIVNSGTLIFAKGNTTPVAATIHVVGGAPGVTVNGGTLQLAGAYTSALQTGVNAQPAGYSTTTYVDQIYNAVGVVLNAGTFDLNGREEAINTLTNPLGLGGTVTNTAAATAAKLYIGHQNGTSTFDGVINDGTGTVAIEKIGTGALTLTGTSNFTGGLTVTAGTLVLDGTISNASAIAVNGTSIFAGAGSSGGTLSAATGATVRVGTVSGGTVATTLTLGGLTLSGGANLNLDFNTAGTTLDKIATTVANGVSISGANPINVVLSGAGWVTGTYPILTYVGAVQGTGASNATLVLSTPVGHSTVNVVDDTLGIVSLSVTGTVNKWVGNINSVWDTNTTLNWNAGDQMFLTGDTVVFDDTATTFTPNIAVNQTASGVTFDNTTAYTLTSTGAFGIAGTGGLIKKNSGSVTISTANTYTGATDVQAGTLIANYNTGTAQTVIAVASTINVALGATFRAVTNDADLTLANNLTGSGLVVIDPHFTAGAAVRNGNVTGNNAGFTGTLRLSPTVIGDGSGTFRTTTNLTPTNTGGATIDVDAGGQAWLAAGTFTNNFILSGHGYAETAGGTPVAASGLTQYSGALKGGIGAIRMAATTITGSVTLDGSAKIMAYGATGIISGSIFVTNPTDMLVVGGGNSASTLVLTGSNNVGGNALNQIFVNAGGTTGTQSLLIGANGTVGTLGTGAVTLNGDGASALIRFDRSDAYTLLVGNTITASGTTVTNTFVEFDTQGTGFNSNGVAITLGTAASGGTLRVGHNRANTVTTINGTLTGAGLSVGSAAAGTGATLNLNSGANVSVATITVAAAATNATLNIAAGATVATTGNFFLGEGAGFSGAVSQTGGAVTVGSHVRVGHYPTETSSYNISAGTLTIANINAVTDPSTGGAGELTGGIYLGVDGTGTMAHSGGTVTTDWIVLDNRVDTLLPGLGIDSYTLSGSGLLVLRSQWGITQRNASTAVTLSGGTIQNGGTNLQVRLDTAADISGAVTLDTVSAGNSFNWLRNATGAGSLALSGGGTLKFTTATAQSVAVPITGTGALQKLGIGSTTLSNANTYNGTTTISAGTLQVGAANALPSGAGKGNVVFSAAATSSVLDLNGFDTSINGLSQNTVSTLNLVVNNATGTSKTLTLGNNDATADFAGIIADNTSGTGTLALTKVGTGTQTLGGASTFTGAINVNGGLLAFASSPATGGPLGNSTAVSLNGGGLSYTVTGTSPLNRTVVIGAGNGTFNVVNSTGILTAVGTDVTSTGGNLVKTGPGTLSLSGTTTLNSGASGVQVSDGILQAGFGATGISTIDVGANGNLRLQNSIIETLTLGNTAGALTLAGGAKLGFEFDGATNDRINVGATGTPVLTAGIITLDLFNFGAGLAGGNTYNLLSTTLGDLTNAGATTYALGTAPSGFNYTLNQTSNLISLGVVTFSPAYWTNSQTGGSWSTLNGVGPFTSNFSTDAAGTLNLAALPGSNETVFFSSTPIAGPTVTTTLDGNFTLYGLNFIAGSGTVTDVSIDQGSSGTLTIRPSAAAGGIDVGTNAGNIIINAPLVASNTNSATQTWNVDGTGANSSLTLNGVTTFTANVIKTGAGTLTLGNAGNTGAGNFSLSGGTLKISAAGNVPTGVFTIGAGTTIDNTSAGVIALGNSAYTWNGNFTQTGESLNLGSSAVTLGATVQATVVANTLTVGGAIDDGASTFGLTKAGAGTLLLSGTSTYNGATVITDGTLSLTGSLTGGSAISTSGTGILSESAAGGISGASTFTQGSSATSVLAGINTHTGLTSVTAGTLSLTGSITGGGAISTSGTGIFTESAAGLISGASTLTQGSSGSTTLAGNNTYSGGTTLSAGTLNVDASGTSATNSAIGTGTFTITGGTIDNSSGSLVTLATNNALALNGNFAFTGTNNLNLGTGAVTTTATRVATVNAGTLTIGGSVTLGGSLVKAGNGTMALTGTGTVALANNKSVIVTGGILTFGGALTATSTASNGVFVGNAANSSGAFVQTGGSVTISGADNTNIFNVGNATTNAGGNTGASGGFGSYTMTGGTLTAPRINIAGGDSATSGTNGVGLFTVLNGATAKFNNFFIGGRNSATNTGVATISGGTLDLTAMANQTGAFGGGRFEVNLGANLGGSNTGGTFNATSKNYTIVANAATSQGITNLLGGTLTTSQVNTAVAATGIGIAQFNFNGGTLRAGIGVNAAFIPAITGAAAGSGVFVRSGGAIIDTNAQNVGIAAALLAPTGGEVTSITTSATGFFTAPYVRIVGGNNDATAVAIIDGAGAVTSIVITNPGTGYTVDPTVTLVGGTTAGGTNITAAATATVGASTSGGLTKIGLGTLSLSGANTYTGATTVSLGTLQLGSGGATGSLSASSAISVALGATFAVNQTDTVTQGIDFSAGISGDGNFAQTGSGITTLNGTNTYTGATNVTVGQLRISSATALDGTSGIAVTSGAMLALDGGIIVGSGKTITINGSGVGFAGALSTTSGNNEWAGNVTLGSASARIGNLGLAAGDLKISGVIDSGVNVFGPLFRAGIAGTSVTLSGASTYLGDTTIATTSGGGSVILSGGANRLPTTTKLIIGVTTVPGVLDLNGQNQEVAGISVGQASGTFSNEVKSTAAATFTVNTATASPSTYSGLITGDISLVKTGADVLTLTGTNTFTGATTLSDGTLQIGAAGVGGITATSSVTVVKTGATYANAPILSGSGSIGGAIVIGDTMNAANKGILAPGDAGSSLNRTLTSTGSLTVAAGSQVLLGITSPTGTDPLFLTGDAFTYLTNLGSNGGGMMGTAPPAWFTAPSTNQVDHLALGGSLTLGTNAGTATAGQGIVSIFSNSLVPASLTRGQIFNLIDWAGLSVTGFNAGSGFSTGGIHGDFDLPDILSTGLAWDTSAFTSHGVLVVVPEPSRALLLLLGLMSLMLRRRRHN